MTGTAVSDASRTLLSQAVEHAVLAPSSHNTQPWAFQVDGDVVELYADRTRALPVNDPDDRELTISCGAALLNARIAAAHAGGELAVELLPDGAGSDLLARATVAGLGPADHDPLFDAIRRRHTYRKPFADRPAPRATLECLAEAVAAEGAWLEVLEDGRRDAYTSLVAAGDRTQFADRAWRRELAAWVHPRRRGDGLAVPAPAAPATRLVVGHLDLGRSTAGHDVELARQAPVVAVLATGGDTPADWLRAGQALERLLLTAASLGLQASYLNQPLQVADLRPRAAELLERPGHPQVALRIGYPAGEPPRSARRPVADVLSGSPARRSGDREREHRAIGGNALRASVLGANDGLVSNLSLVMGVAGADLSNRSILITGLAGLLAGASSMAMGEWISVQSARELFARELEVERRHLAEWPEEEREELAGFYRAKGVPGPAAAQAADALMADERMALDAMAHEELGIDPRDLGGSAWVAAASSFALFVAGALVPVLPFALRLDAAAVAAALAMSALGLFVLGASIGRLTGHGTVRSGLRQVAIGLAAAGVTYSVGALIGVTVG